MMIIKKKTIIAFLLLTFLLCGCQFFSFNYNANYEKALEKKVQAENCLLGMIGNKYARIITIDKDKYGRTLFFYSDVSIAAGTYLYSSEQLWTILILQKTDDEFVYYYPDLDFIVKPLDKTESILNNDDLLASTFLTLSEEEITKFKKENDWNEPINAEKCIKKRIVDLSVLEKSKMVEIERQSEVFNKEFYNRYPQPDAFFWYLTSDDFDRHIYFCRTVDGNEIPNHSYVIMFLPDNTYIIEEIYDLWNYRELRDFKENNNWNKPYKLNK